MSVGRVTACVRGGRKEMGVRVTLWQGKRSEPFLRAWKKKGAIAKRRRPEEGLFKLEGEVIRNGRTFILCFGRGRERTLRGKAGFKKKQLPRKRKGETRGKKGALSGKKVGESLSGSETGRTGLTV